jgi:predicted Kef-type K+ transport protein
VGLLFDPHVLLDRPGQVLTVLGVVMLCKFVASFAVCDCSASRADWR